MRTQASSLRTKELLGIEPLSPEEISLILDTAEGFKEVSKRTVKKVPALRGQLVINLFMEATTRTRVSFEIAKKRLSADTLNFAASGSSVEKGETLIDTAENLMAMRPDMIVIRHKHPGAPKMLAERPPASIINTRDRAHEHPPHSRSSTPSPSASGSGASRASTSPSSATLPTPASSARTSTC